MENFHEVDPPPFLLIFLLAFFQSLQVPNFLSVKFHDFRDFCKTRMLEPSCLVLLILNILQNLQF